MWSKIYNRLIIIGLRIFQSNPSHMQKPTHVGQIRSVGCDYMSYKTLRLSSTIYLFF